MSMSIRGRSSLDHARRRLHRSGGGDAGDEPEILDGIPRHRRDHAVGTGLDLDERHDAVDLDGPDHAREAVACGEAVSGRLSRRRGAEPVDLGPRDTPSVARIAHRAQLAAAVPAAEGVDADAQGARRLPKGEVVHLSFQGTHLDSAQRFGVRRITYGKSPNSTSIHSRPVARTVVVPVCAAVSNSGTAFFAPASEFACGSRRATNGVCAAKSRSGSSGAYCSKRAVYVPDRSYGPCDAGDASPRTTISPSAFGFLASSGVTVDVVGGASPASLPPLPQPAAAMQAITSTIDGTRRDMGRDGSGSRIGRAEAEVHMLCLSTSVRGHGVEKVDRAQFLRLG